MIKNNIYKILVGMLLPVLLFSCTPAFIMEKTGLEEKTIHRRKFPADTRYKLPFSAFQKEAIRTLQNYNKKWDRSTEAVPVKIYFIKEEWGYIKNSESIFNEPSYRYVYAQAAFKYTKKDGVRWHKFADKGWCYMIVPILFKQSYRGAATETDIHNDKFYGETWMDTTSASTQRMNILCENIK